jgi:hypothetical protein
MTRQPTVGPERVEELQAHGRPVHHRRGDRVVDPHHVVVGHGLEPGVLARVGPGQKRRILPGANGFRMVAVGGRPGEA